MARPRRTVTHPARGVTVLRRPYRGPDGKIRYVATWTIRVWVRGEETIVNTGLRTLEAAEHAALQLRDDLERAAVGIRPPERVTIGALVDEYERELARRGSSTDHVARTGRYCRAVLALARAPADVTPQLVREGLERIEGAARTRNAHRTAVRALFAWLVREGRFEGANPAEAVRPVRVVDDAPARRALSLEELARLLEAAPLERRLAYAAAAMTGLRRAELNALRWSDLDLEARLLRLPSALAKARKAAAIPLPEVLVELLGRVRAARTSGAAGRHGRTRVGWAERDRVLAAPRVETLREDLLAARVDPDDHGQGPVDFHSLRVTYSTLLGALGVGLGARQALMRHSDPRLTTGPYQTVWAEELRRAADQLGEAVAGARAADPATDTLGGAEPGPRGSRKKPAKPAAPGTKATRSSARPGTADTKPKADSRRRRKA